MADWDLLLTDARIATLVAGDGDPYGIRERAAIAINDGRITWVGAEQALPKKRRRKRAPLTAVG
jgi:imidazolonepropionase-like amidohydrolase